MKPTATAPPGAGEIKYFFAFLLSVTVFLSFEAGIVSSMMHDIKRDLSFNFANTGQVAGAPDYGIVPSGILAGLVFSYVRATPVFFVSLVMAGAVSMYLAMYPSLFNLIVVRALSGFCWGFCAVHIPAWINDFAPAERRTMWVAFYQVALLGGILLGYVVGGGLGSAFPWLTWQKLFCVEGLLMLGSAIVFAGCFRSDVVELRSKKQQHAKDANLITETTTLLKDGSISANSQPSVFRLYSTLLRDPVFVLTVATGAIQAAIVGYLLYFITQWAHAVMTISAGLLTAMVGAGFILGPVAGILIGGKLTTNVGGYTNYAGALPLMFQMFSAALAAACLYPLITYTHSPVLFSIANVLMLMTGSMPVAIINGVAISAVPGASHQASGLQFSIQNGLKLAIPVIGGAIIDRTSLSYGFAFSLLACVVMIWVTSGLCCFVGKDRTHPDFVETAKTPMKSQSA